MIATPHDVQHPLIDEALTIRNVINEIVDSARLAMLRALRDLATPTTQTDIANHIDLSRQAVSPYLAGLQDHGFVRCSDSGAELTAGGKLLLEEMEKCLYSITDEQLSSVTRSAHPLILLQELTKSPYRLRDLQTTASNLPSKATIRRTLTEFVQYEWLEEDAGQYRITAVGSDALQAYSELSTVVEQLIKKIPWLQRLPLDAATVPVEALAEADLSVSNPRSPASALLTCLDLYDPHIHKFRCMCSVYNPVLFHAYHGLLKLGIESEAILDWPTYEKAADNSRTHYAVESERYDHYQPLVLEESQTMGIGIYDNRKVAIAAYNEAGDGNHIAMIQSSDDRLVGWGIELYESFRAKARPTSKIHSE
ncbi:transcriptional regulator FilR1 domain-containing protein [Haladaptatus salinisoli]|uniref:transcriptional regulator FilR1 domain-containing protein n=1 Tax=Haladaptatus salinisoli TaxID=2884876 RepID=UPI001D0B7D5C|nr:helix-turn-helix domain-containing protein [Haladaptatus salinisoli]